MRTKAETMQGLITKYLPKDPDEANAFMYELDILLMRYDASKTGRCKADSGQGLYQKS